LLTKGTPFSERAKPWKLGIVGWPLGYSLSPVMHNAALKAAGFPETYKEIKKQPGEELQAWLEEKAPQMDGFNVTMPHKEAVYKWVREHGEVRGVLDLPFVRIDAVNTVKVEKGRLIGCNTDGSGFFHSLPKDLDLKGKSVLLLGAGGAAKAIADYLDGAVQIGLLKIWNRHPERAEELAKRINAPGGVCRASAFTEAAEISLDGIDLVVNATSLGMKDAGDVPTEVLRQLNGRQVVYDIVYQPLETKLIKVARERKCRTITGDEMLLNQGVEAFEIWMSSGPGDGKPISIGGRSVREIMKEALNERLLRQPEADSQ